MITYRNRKTGKQIRRSKRSRLLEASKRWARVQGSADVQASDTIKSDAQEGKQGKSGGSN